MRLSNIIRYTIQTPFYLFVGVGLFFFSLWFGFLNWVLGD